MDGRKAMGSSSYYIHRAMGAQNPTLTSQSAYVGGSRPTQNPSFPNPSFQNPCFQNPRFQMESSSSAAVSVSAHGVNSSGGSLVGEGEEQVKRKRGRPRKYGPVGNVALALSPSSASTSTPAPISGSGGPKRGRGRGRPPGTGRKQQLASLGEWVVGSAGMGFKPHIITIGEGEDIAAKIMSFSQQGPRAICILSANGVVSTITLRKPQISGGTVTYEGRFEIQCLSGSYLVTDDGRSGGLSISLSSIDGRMIGGGIGGSLIAASPVQVVVGSFLYGGSKMRNRSKIEEESSKHEMPAVDDHQSTPISTVMGGWPGSRQIDTTNALDIDLTRG